MSNRKATMILLGVVALTVLSAGLYWFAVGSTLVGVVLFVLGVLSLVWIWRTWSQARKA